MPRNNSEEERLRSLAESSDLAVYRVVRIPKMTPQHEKNIPKEGNSTATSRSFGGHEAKRAVARQGF